VAVVINITAVTPLGAGNFIAYPTGTPTFTSVLNYQSGETALANGAIVAACVPNCTNQLTIAVNGAGADAVIDIAGYFKPPGAPLPVTTVVAGTGLAGGGTSGTVGVSIASGGVGNAQLASGAVDVSKLNTTSTDARYFKQGGNAFGSNPTVLGTTDNNALQFIVGNAGARLMFPDPISPVIQHGFGGNGLTPGASGAVIGGGGATGTTVLSFGCGGSACANRVTDAFGTVGGGAGNQAGDGAGTATDKPFATVAGGLGNAARGIKSTVGGGNGNSANGQSSTVAGGQSNLANNDYSAIGGGFKQHR
jgi:hypothetical protein